MDPSADPPADPKIADKLARMNLAGKISQTKPGCRTLLGRPRPKRSVAKPGEKFEVNAVEDKNAVAGKTMLAKPPSPKPGAAEPSSPVEAKRPSAWAVKGAALVTQSQSAIEEAAQRRAEAVEALAKGADTERDLNRAVIAEEDTALAFHQAAMTYGQAMIDAHSDIVLSAGGTRALTRLQAEMGLRRKKYEQARLQTQAHRTAE